jgi:hypothetical protein
MPKSRAEIQKAYRERKKAKDQLRISGITSSAIMSNINNCETLS